MSIVITIYVGTFCIFCLLCETPSYGQTIKCVDVPVPIVKRCNYVFVIVSINFNIMKVLKVSLFKMYNIQFQCQLYQKFSFAHCKA